jgi:hypothetical protein
MPSLWLEIIRRKEGEGRRKERRKNQREIKEERWRRRKRRIERERTQLETHLKFINFPVNFLPMAEFSILRINIPQRLLGLTEHC